MPHLRLLLMLLLIALSGPLQAGQYAAPVVPPGVTCSTCCDPGQLDCQKSVEACKQICSAALLIEPPVVADRPDNPIVGETLAAELIPAWSSPEFPPPRIVTFRHNHTILFGENP